MNQYVDVTDVVLTTHRLTLRSWKKTDLRDFYAYASVDGVGQMAGWLPHSTVEESEKILAMFMKNKNVFAIEYQGRVIGSLGIESYEERYYPELQHLYGCEIGYVLSKEHWGHGLMPEAVHSVISWLFETAGLDFILVGHFDWNYQSQRVVEKCGFQYIKTVRYHTQYGSTEASLQYIRYRKTPHHFMDGFHTADDTALVREIYRRYDENSRLTCSQAARVEFLTTVRYVERYLFPGAKILDLGAGTGVYSLYFAQHGYDVTAVELSEHNIAAFQTKLTGDHPVELIQGNAMDLSRFPDASFDIILLLGPLYHLHNESDKLLCIAEAKRVCKPNGKIFLGFISNDIVILTMQQEQSDYLLNGAYDKDTFQLKNFPFVFHAVKQCRELLSKGGIQICHEIAADALSELLADLINAMDEKTFQQYLRYHYYTCEKPECIGFSNHLLFVGGH